MKRLGGYIAGLMIVTGLMLLIGTAGASDYDEIGFTRILIQSGISLALILVGYLLSTRLGGIVNVD